MDIISSQDSQDAQDSLSCPETAFEDSHPLIRHTFNYLRENQDRAFERAHFAQYLKDNQVKVTPKAVKQITSFAELYFSGTSIARSLLILKAKPRYSPYNRESERLRGNRGSTSIPSSPPSSQTLRRAGSFMDMDIPAIPASTPVQINVSFFNGVGGGSPVAKIEGATERQQPRCAEDIHNNNGTLSVDVVLPDDFKTKVHMSSQEYVFDLLSKIRNIMLTRYPLKNSDDLPLDKFLLKTRGGWELNPADRLTGVIHDGTVLYCIFV